MTLHSDVAGARSEGTHVEHAPDLLNLPVAFGAVHLYWWWRNCEASLSYMLPTSLIPRPATLPLCTKYADGLVRYMAARIFALIIGIDSYKSGRIWNLRSCENDARRMKRWLTEDLDVPCHHICLLLGSQATKSGIEDAFMSHLVNNPSVEQGDALLFYFAGHGSCIPAPPGWFQSETGVVSVLCPHDHDTQGVQGRIAGISDRSFHALIGELGSKGDNITVVLDCCFSRVDVRGRSRERTRWTPTLKATGEDLYPCLWRGAIGNTVERGQGFYSTDISSHTVLAACKPGERAEEDMQGGKFTRAFLEVVRSGSLYQTSYAQLGEHIEASMGEDQHPVCLGENKHRVIFDAVPFVPDTRFVPAASEDGHVIRVEMGAIHGITEGTEFSLHGHNRRRSRNPLFASIRAVDVHPTWCLAACPSGDLHFPDSCWARVTQWNNHIPFRVHLRKTFCSLIRWWKMRLRISAKLSRESSKGALNILLVKHATQADIILDISRRRESVVQRNDELITTNSLRTIRLKNNDQSHMGILENAAHFHLHLHRQNPQNPLRNLVTMELYRLDPYTWSKIGGNLLESGTAHIVYEKSAIYTLIMRNASNFDLWPYLACLDPVSYGVAMIYNPSSSLQTPPLPNHGSLEIGSGKPGSEALSFTVPEHGGFVDSLFLKLFISSTFVPMGVIEQGPALTAVGARDNATLFSKKEDPVWDTVFACITFLRDY